MLLAAFCVWITIFLRIQVKWTLARILSEKQVECACCSLHISVQPNALIRELPGGGQ